MRAFRGLADETRMAIVTALVERRRESPEDPGLSFSALRERAGVEDSGRFNYHLRQLVGRFVEHDDDGYRLNAAGRRIAGALAAGAYTGGVSLGPEPLDEPCPACGASVVASYDEGVLELSCEDDHTLFRTRFPSGGAAGRSVEEVMRLAVRTALQDLEFVVDGVCPECYGRANRRLEFPEGDGSDEGEDDPDLPALRADCERCGMHVRTSTTACLLIDPDVRAFYRDHGRDPLGADFLTLDLFDVETPAVLDGEVHFEIALDGERLRATVDGEGRVASVERAPAEEDADGHDAAGPGAGDAARPAQGADAAPADDDASG
jgi:hypothetical protein